MEESYLAQRKSLQEIVQRGGCFGPAFLQFSQRPRDLLLDRLSWPIFLQSTDHVSSYAKETTRGSRIIQWLFQLAEPAIFSRARASSTPLPASEAADSCARNFFQQRINLLGNELLAAHATESVRLERRCWSKRCTNDGRPKPSRCA